MDQSPAGIPQFPVQDRKLLCRRPDADGPPETFLPLTAAGSIQDVILKYYEPYPAWIYLRYSNNA